VSIYALSWVLRHSEAQLGPRLVLLVLADHAKDDGTFAWPAIDTIAKHARLSRRAVQAALRKLEADGAIVNRGKTKNGVVIYDVQMGAQNLHGGVAAAPQGAKLTTSRGEAASPEPSGTVKGTVSSPERSSHEPVEFGEWMGHHHVVTGMDVLRAGTQARRKIAAMYAARRKEGYSHEDLKLAVDGAWADDFRREKGHVGHESVLRPTKVADLISKGRKARAAAESRSAYDALEDR
jgi:hypothetical protein